jgi:hypothetical protein
VGAGRQPRRNCRAGRMGEKILRFRRRLGWLQTADFGAGRDA